MLPRLIKAVLFSLCVGMAMASAAQDMPGGDEVLIASSLLPESPTPAAGSTTTLAILMQPQGDWHGYWKQPGDVGLAPNLTWQLPEGVSIGEAAYPVPQTLLTGDVMNHVYKHPYALLVPLRIAADLPLGSTLSIGLDLKYLACRHDACVPEQATLATQLRIGDGAPDPALRQRFAAWRQALPRPLGSPASFVVDAGSLRLSVPFPANMAVDQPHLFVEPKGVIDNAAPQRFERQGDVLLITTQSGPRTPNDFTATLSLGGGLGLELQAKQAVALPSGAGTLRTTLLALAGAVLGGLLLNLMPCVFPILSLKALSIARATSSAATARREALAYAVGVVLVCVLLGALLLALRAGGAQLGWAFQLQDPRVILLLLLLTCAIAFNLAGLFELSSVNAGDRLAQREGISGAFWTGALAAFVATPCTGPFMAVALGAALVLPTAAAVLVFAGLGLGIALPFLLLGFMPALQRRLPKPGPWMQSFRRLLAIPMFLTALALLWVLSQQVAPSALVASIGCAMLLAFGLWMSGLRQRGSHSSSWMPAALAATLAIGLGLSQLAGKPSIIPAQSEPLTFDAPRLESLRAQLKPVFVYFTADWCVTCKVNENVAIDREETSAAFNAADVAVMRGDWTHGDPQITGFLERYGRSGVPLYLWFPPGQSEPQVLPQLLSPGLLSELAGY